MAPLTSTSRPSAEDSETPCNNLWVGNLAGDVSDSHLMEIFAQYGALDSVTSYSLRSYAFVFFKRMEDAKAAKEALQGTVLRGSPIKIEFARPAKPSKHLWVGGISTSVSKEELVEEFLKFGKIEDFKFMRDRNTSFIEYFRLEDAFQAMKSMNGKRLGGEQIRVDFLRSQPSRKEQWPESIDGQFHGRSMLPANLPPGHRRQLYSQASGGRKGDGQPSKVLWIGYPPSVQIDEQMLHNALILFGEIERIKSFPSRHYSFVEFRSVDEARRAKEGLQGRLFNDPRITIMFSSSELAPGKDSPGPYPGGEGPRADVFCGPPFQPLQGDMLGLNHPIMPNNFAGSLPPNSMLGRMPIRSFGPQGRFDPLLLGPELNDVSALSNYQEGNSKNLMGPNWRSSPPTPNMLSSPASNINGHTRSASGACDLLDVNQFQRDSKRSRSDGLFSSDDASFPSTKIDDHGLALNRSYGLGSGIDGGVSGPFANVPGKSCLSPGCAMVSAGRPAQVHSENDYIWRGVIAKGGTPVCHVRCIPIGKGIGADLPEVVNCSARTGLDMLTKHYADANGFDIVFFLPDSEDDFASYTEFLRYLGAKSRAGVAKFDDGTTLFLVPPSDFLTDILKVTGPERLYGVVLKFPQSVSADASMQHQSYLPIPSSQYMDRQQMPPFQVQYGVAAPLKDEPVSQMDYSRFLQDSKLHSKPLLPPKSDSPVVQSISQDYASNGAAATSQAGVSLTPELIATLATLLPSNAQSSAPEGANPQNSSNVRPSFSYAPPNKATPSSALRQDSHPTLDHAGHALQQLGSQFNLQGKNTSQFQSCSSFSNAGHSVHLVHGGTHFQDPTVNLPQQATISYRPLGSFPTPQGVQVASPHLTQYQVDTPPSTQRNYMAAHGTDASGFYNIPVSQQLNSAMTLSSQPYNPDSAQSQGIVPVGTEKVNTEVSNQVQQLQSALLGGQGASEGEADKNQRYQSTLQFAANLLLQIQQQQQIGTQAGRGSGSQQ